MHKTGPIRKRAAMASCAGRACYLQELGVPGSSPGAIVGAQRGVGLHGTQQPSARPANALPMARRVATLRTWNSTPVFLQ
jgi:hypothetical protein